MPNILEISQ